MGNTSRMRRSSRRSTQGDHFAKINRSVADARNCSMPPIIYGPEGQHIAKLLYEETLNEMSFAGVRDILERL